MTGAQLEELLREEEKVYINLMGYSISKYERFLDITQDGLYYSIYYSGITKRFKIFLNGTQLTEVPTIEELRKKLIDLL